MSNGRPLNAERQRLENHRLGKENWRLWGPYLSERAWGTVREDYSAYGDAWDFLPHDQARSRAYRWSEDGLGGISDENQFLCLALALWNGRDPFLKERAFGLTGPQGNRGEDVKEYYFYLDATPSHSYLRYLYKYPQAAYPYERLVEENARRDRNEPPFNLLDTGVFDDGRYFDVEVIYAKAGPDEIHIRIIAHNRGPEAGRAASPAHLVVPQHLVLGRCRRQSRALRRSRRRRARPGRCKPTIPSSAPTISTAASGPSCCSPRTRATLSGCGATPNATPYVKDAFHRCVVDGENDAVNPERSGTKFAAWHKFSIPAGQHVRLDLVLSAQPLATPFARSEVVFSTRQGEANVFFDELLPEAGPEDHRILRQALAGMIWCKQFFHYDVERWLKGDRLPPPDSRRYGRNRQWKHLKAGDVISMPDSWEYPWFAAWDLAFHCGALALIDVDFAKDQIELMLSERYLHPNGQIPAYEWNFGDVNPPVHALARAQGVPRRAGAARARRPRLPAARLPQAAAELRLVDQPQGRRRPQRLRRRLPRPRQHLGLRPLAAAAAGLQPEAGRRHRLGGDVRAQHDGDGARAGDRGLGLRGHRHPVYEQFLAIANTIGGHTRRRRLAVGPGGRLLQGPDRARPTASITASTSTRWSA